VFSDPIHQNREKEKTKTKKMMGWIENGPKKSGGGFLSVNSFPPKLKRYLLDLSVLYKRPCPQAQLFSHKNIKTYLSHTKKGTFGGLPGVALSRS
jgi:hypothetical protein